MLRPCKALNNLIAGVIGRAQARYTAVSLYAAAFLSNHMHLILQGPPNEVPAFIGFIKREISRRWGRRPDVNWPGTMWHEYKLIALTTDTSQIEGLKYVLAQGTKEGLVLRPEDWPGFHCARSLLHGEDLTGAWLNATAYSRATSAERRKSRPTRVHESKHRIEYTVRFTPIPAWAHLDAASQRSEARRLAQEIEVEARTARGGRPPLGARGIHRVPLDRRSELPKPPWFEQRRRVICRGSPNAPETIAHIARYLNFQERFRMAATAGDHLPIVARMFPEGAFVPGMCNAGKEVEVAA